MWILPHPHYHIFRNWASSQKSITKSVFPSLNKNTIHKIDLSVRSNWIGRKEEFNDLDHFQFKIDQLQKHNQKKLLQGVIWNQEFYIHQITMKENVIRG